MKKPRSLVLITVDCLRADHVGFLGYQRPTTPFLDSLSTESIVFNNAIVAGAPTDDSFPGIMASRHSLALGRDMLGLAPEEPTLATVLHEAGYATAAFAGGNPYLSKQFGYAAGFEVYEDFLKYADDAESELLPKKSQLRTRLNSLLEQTAAKVGLRALYEELYFQYGQRMAASSPRSLDQLRRFPAAHVIVAKAGEWLQQISTGVPFFLWLHLMDPHSPYYPTPESLDLMQQKQITAERARYLNSYWNRPGLSEKRFAKHCEELVSLYDSGIRWVDHQLSTLVNVLRKLELWDDCLFAVTADHGEEFLEHGDRMHAPPKVNEEIVHVPLLIRIPGVVAKNIEGPFSLLDLSPTLLDCMQIPIPADFRGRSLWQEIKGGESLDHPAIVECIALCSNPFHKENRLGSRLLAVRDKRYKLVLDLHSSVDRLFDLETDPGELRPLAVETEKPVRRRLMELARKHIAESSASRDLGHRSALVLRNIFLENGQNA